MTWKKTKLGYVYEKGRVVAHLDGWTEAHAADGEPAVERWSCCVSVRSTNVGQPVLDQNQVYLAYEQELGASGLEDAQRAAILFATEVLRTLALSWNA